jgi:hypothetical protein
MYFRNMSRAFDLYYLKSSTARKLYFMIKCELNYEISQICKTKKFYVLLIASWYIHIVIVMYILFFLSLCMFRSALCLIVLFCVLFVCKCVLDYCHRDIGALFDYPNWGFSSLFPQLYGKCQGITRKDGARPALPNNFCFFLLLCMFRSVYLWTVYV